MRDPSLLAVVFEEVWDLVPRRRNCLKARLEDRDEVLLISCAGPARTSETHTFNRTAGQVFSLCDGHRNLGEIVREMASRYPEAGKARITEDVIRVLRTMERKGILTFIPEAGSPAGR